MITTPNRIGELIKLVEGGPSEGETELDFQVRLNSEFRKVATLQPLDLAVAGRQFVEDAIKYQETEHASAEQLLSNPNL